MLKLGIIGTSWITANFIQAATETKAYELTTVYSRTTDKAQAFIANYDLQETMPQIVTTLEDLATSDSDVVYIASPNSLHFEQAAKLITADKHVIVEKPAFSNPKEMAAISELLKAHPNTYLFEAARNQHQPNFKTLQQQLKKMPPISGAVFNYMQYSSKYDAYLAGENPNIFSPEFSAGALQDLGVYLVYTAVNLFGVPKQVTYHPQKLANGIDGSGVAILKYPNFQVTLNISKTNASHLASEIYAQKELLTINHLGSINKITYQDQAQDLTELVTPDADNTMIYEAAVFATIINQKDQSQYQALFKLSQAVNQVLYDLRQSAQIKFAAD